MFSQPHGKKLIFLNFSGFGIQIEGGQNMVSIDDMKWILKNEKAYMKTSKKARRTE